MLLANDTEMYSKNIIKLSVMPIHPSHKQACCRLSAGQPASPVHNRPHLVFVKDLSQELAGRIPLVDHHLREEGCGCACFLCDRWQGLASAGTHACPPLRTCPAAKVVKKQVTGPMSP